MGFDAILDQENSGEATNAGHRNFFALVAENFGDLFIFVRNTLLLIIGLENQQLLLKAF